MRLFVAAVLPPNLIHDLKILQDQLRMSEVGVRRVPVDNMHITLCFLGDRDEESLEKIQFDMATIDVPDTKPVIKFHAFEIYPRMDEPRVVVLSLLDKNNVLSQLGEQLCSRLGGTFNPPHITLGRFSKSHTRSDAVEILGRDISLADDEYRLDEICLFESELTGSGPVYTRLEKIALS